MYHLAARNAVGAALAACGVRRDSTDVLCALLAPAATDEAALRALLRGGRVAPLAELPALRDDARVRRLYDVSDAELTCASLEDAALNRIALFGLKQ